MLTREQCIQFMKTPNINPLTGRTIKPHKKTYRDFISQCQDMNSKATSKTPITSPKISKTTTSSSKSPKTSTKSNFLGTSASRSTGRSSKISTSRSSSRSSKISTSRSSNKSIISPKKSSSKLTTTSSSKILNNKQKDNAFASTSTKIKPTKVKTTKIKPTKIKSPKITSKDVLASTSNSTTSASSAPLQEAYIDEQEYNGPEEYRPHHAVRENPLDRYRLSKMLGSGSFGDIFLAYDTETSEYVAIKFIKYSVVKKYNEQFKDIPPIEFEVNVLKKLNGSKYVVKYIESFRTIQDGILYQCIVTEYVNGRSLGDIFYDDKYMFTTNDLIAIIMQLIMGCLYIHQHDLAHRDIKLDNIMVTKDGTVKFIDFGLSCIDSCKSHHDRKKSNNNCLNNCKGKLGTIDLRPPEMFTSSYNKRSLKNAQAHDIWSLSIVFYMLANGNFPFNSFKDERILSHSIVNDTYRTSKYRYDVSDHRIDHFIDGIIDKNPNTRITINQMIEKFMIDVITKIANVEIFEPQRPQTFFDDILDLV